ncbi:hypothetical protein C8R47DRAFT_1271968 [Mycena vitilis]|nr:hypothetical protein C8R47DRAFT_1271968 [Mycena vitilis]
MRSAVSPRDLYFFLPHCKFSESSLGRRGLAILLTRTRSAIINAPSTSISLLTYRHVHVNPFVVYAPDKTDEGVTERRLSVKAQHEENGAKYPPGLVRAGGSLLTSESTEAEKKTFGSMAIFQAENIEAVRAIIEADIYYTSGVWDPERLVIFPFAGMIVGQ